MTDEEDEKLEEVQAGKVADADTGANGKVSIFRSIRPATAGISFALSHTGSAPSLITIAVSVGQYSKVELSETDVNGGAIQGEQPQEHTTTEASFQVTSKASKKCKWYWSREHKVCSRTVALELGIQEIDLGTMDDAGSGTVPGLALFIKTVSIGGKIAVTVQAINQNRHDASSTRDEVEQQTFFQFQMNISPVAPTELVPRPVLNVPNDEDAKTSALIYRDAVEYATGHTCSADWIVSDESVVSTVSSAWMPEKIVKSVDPSGDPIFKTTYDKRGLGMPTAQRLSVASESELRAIFSGLTDAYENWLQQEAAKTEVLGSDALRNRAEIHLSRCGEALERMRFGASQIVADDQVRRAFQCANAAMQIQAAWGQNIPSGISESPGSQLEWRPFQLGFALMCIRSFQEPSHDDRSILDLIWFPTGGGKTEAYLLVAAFAMFYRRLINQEKALCYGTNVLMRYTLRTLTIQQFQRAAALVCACERVREGEWNQDDSMGGQKFSIGLWVGQASTPNNSQMALEVLGTDSESTPCQIEQCPACRRDLVWKPSEDETRVICRCETEDCILAKWDELPILTVDDQIYRTPPTMLIGTVDKFAQIVRREEVGVLFGLGSDADPPDLIIQDELHLISGPLGTLAGIYETIIDRLCTKDGIVPKVIGSTATIRRAEQQVNALFQRRAFQFPPPVIDGENSGFSKIDVVSDGRLYVGLTTSGRTDKYMMQAVCASLLQAVVDPSINDEDRDPYGTLVAYFNSLRILGGALVAMQDDVPKSIGAIARRRGERPRTLSEPEEMTSRKASSEIPKVLRQLNIRFGDAGSIDTLLASNMLSVGVDIPRLGLMVVNGQPKTMSEYIQATSRVGRQQVPGLIVVIYNNSKPRDKAHYETFETWHASLYRSIEATSVTPFASRARDKALHAALVGLARHLIPNLSGPTLSAEKRMEIEDKILPILFSRIENVDERELGAAQRQLERLLYEWEDRGILKSYWNDFSFKTSLLISAEKAAARKESGYSETAAWETPNSMRNVEPGVDFQLWESAELERG
ncbi:MAG: helicase-related protein [Halieaceae bacterium]|nr:helicase-related protein [Halieaceae bacterium]